MPRKPTIPSYRLHKKSGQAVVTLPYPDKSREDVYLGRFDSEESKEEYIRIIAEWQAGKRRRVVANASSDLTINELAVRYLDHAEEYYVKNGKPTDQQARIRLALRVLREAYGHKLVTEFGPLALKAVRERMLSLPCGLCKGTGITKGKRTSRKKGSKMAKDSRPCGKCNGKKILGWSRGNINVSIGCITRIFAWGVAEELVPAAIYQALKTVRGLTKGRTQAREPEPVHPVADAHVDATLPHLTSVVRAMVLLQRFTGARPGEVIVLRPCDIKREPDCGVWTYRPHTHKGEHHDQDRVIFIGPKAQEVLTPFLNRPGEAYCFSPREAMAEFRARQRSGRKTPVQPSQVCRKKPKPTRQPGECYTTDTYGNAVERACIRAAIPPWHPHQLRHTQATAIRKKAGLDAARVVLGHRSSRVTETYVEVDQEKAKEIMERIG